MTEYNTFSFDKGDFVDGDDNGFKPGYMKVGSENKKKEADILKVVLQVIWQIILKIILMLLNLKRVV